MGKKIKKRGVTDWVVHIQVVFILPKFFKLFLKAPERDEMSHKMKNICSDEAKNNL
jgi:hypothetical protein